MITGELISMVDLVDRIWDTVWSGGISNPPAAEGRRGSKERHREETMQDDCYLIAAARLKQLKVESGEWTAEEERALREFLALAEQAADTGAKLKTAQEELTAKVAAKYPKLAEDEIKTLVVSDKWLATLAAAAQGELDRVSQTLAGRIRQPAERYASPLPQLADEVEQLAAKVAVHLKKMGVEP
jgi:type I restriction enzyme M protein